MRNQGYSLGKQLARWIPALASLATANPGRVWFMGRDMDVFFVALYQAGFDVKYITGLNRDNARKLAHRGKLEGWLRSVGVRDGDILVDSGYNGSIFSRVADNTKLDLYFVLLTANPDGACGTPLSEALNTPTSRNIILALEHSPKREVCTWDDKRRRPAVTKLDGDDGRRAREFLGGCVQALKEAIM